MKAFWISLLCLTVLWTSGCIGTHRRRVNSLERENSQLNGLLWEMEFEIESLEEENQILRKQVADPETDGERPTPRPSRSREPRRPEPIDPGEFRPPTIEFPDEPSPEGTVPDSLLPRKTSATSRTIAPVSVASHQEPAPPEPNVEVVPPEEVSLDSSRIKRIELASLIGTLHVDGKPGDDGLVIVVEPWDGSNQMLADAADITVVLIDPAEPAATSRYAQWKFDAKEAAKLFRDGDLPGLHLELPWPGDPPKHDQLHLFVRYTTSDGRKLETDSIVEVELGGRGRWVATENPRVRPYEQPVQSAEASSGPSPQVPQLLEANTEPVVVQPAEPPRRVRARTVSVPRTEPGESNERSRDRSKPNSSRDRTKALPPVEPAVAPEPQMPTRQRPTWSPDRPW